MGSKHSKISKASKLSLKLRLKRSNSSGNLLTRSSLSSTSQNDTLTTLVNPFTNDTLVDTFKFENGRRYVNDNLFRYLLPNDEEEIDRLQLQHYLIRYIWQSNFSAPVNDILRSGANVLDVGCGPGTWTLEMASEYPKSYFIGIDLAPIFPLEIKPFNTRFQKHDVTRRLPFDDDSFDFIHMRLMLAALRENDWKENVLPELFRVLKPGGYIESHEFDFNIVNQGPCMKLLVDGFIQYFRKQDVNILICPHIPGYLDESNFIDIDVIEESAEYGSRIGRFGKLAIEDFILLFRAVQHQICPIIGIREDEYMNLLNQLEEEVNDYETSYKFYKFIGRKP